MATATKTQAPATKQGRTTPGQAPRGKGSKLQYRKPTAKQADAAYARYMADYGDGEMRARFVAALHVLPVAAGQRERGMSRAAFYEWMAGSVSGPVRPVQAHLKVIWQVAGYVLDGLNEGDAVQAGIEAEEENRRKQSARNDKARKSRAAKGRADSSAQVSTSQLVKSLQSVGDALSDRRDNGGLPAGDVDKLRAAVAHLSAQVESMTVAE